MSIETDKLNRGLPTRLPTGSRPDSFLVDETFLMEQQRRKDEQQGQRMLGKVHEKEHHEEQQQAAPEGELQNSILQHPDLDTQRFDGVVDNPSENPEPPLNSAARTEYDNAKRDQELQKLLNLGLMPKMGTAPEPKP